MSGNDEITENISLSTAASHNAIFIISSTIVKYRIPDKM